MKNTILPFLFLLASSIAFGQNPAEAEKLVDEGIPYHDKGDFEGAIARYDKALEADKDNLTALAEKAMSLNSLEKYEDAIKCCVRAIEKHAGEKTLQLVYVTYGNSYDGLKKTDKSIQIYDEGIKHFPEYYQLYYNKGVTLSSVKKYDEAIAAFQLSASVNPKHPGTHNALGRMLDDEKTRIPSLLAYCRFMILESGSERTNQNLEAIQRIMSANVEKTGDKAISININSNLLEDKKGKSKENNFKTTDLILSMSSALDFDDKNKDKTEVDKFIRKFQVVCNSLEETKKDNYGFYWDYYVPYFIEMNKNKLIEPFAYVVFASSGNKEVEDWIVKNEKELDKLIQWSKNYKWKSK